MATHHLPATDRTVHWGFFSRLLPPVLEVDSGDVVTIETLTHHANDDAVRMIEGDAGAESVYRWDRSVKAVNRRGAGPMEPTRFGRGPGEGLGVHICTGPVAVRGAAPGDVLEVKILDVAFRPCANPRYRGRAFGSNAAAWWGLSSRSTRSTFPASAPGPRRSTPSGGHPRPIPTASCIARSTTPACQWITAPWRSDTACCAG
jgi:Acetamidase/Formamidase family